MLLKSFCLKKGSKTKKYFIFLEIIVHSAKNELTSSYSYGILKQILDVVECHL